MNVDSRTGFTCLRLGAWLLVLLSSAMARAETVTVVTQHPLSYPRVTEQQAAELREAVHATLDAEHGAENITFVTTPRVEYGTSVRVTEKLSTLLEPLRAAGKANLLLLPWISPDDDGFTITVILRAKGDEGSPATVAFSKGPNVRDTAITAIEKAFAVRKGGPTEPASLRSVPVSTTSSPTSFVPVATANAPQRREVTVRPSRMAPLALGVLGLGLAGFGVYKVAQDATCETETSAGQCASWDNSRNRVGGGVLLGLGGAFVAGAATWMVLVGRTGERASVDVSASLSTLYGRVRF